MRKTKLSGIIILLLTAAIWGASFVAQQVGSKSVEAFTYTGIRTCLGAIILLPVTLLINRKIYTDKTSIEFKANALKGVPDTCCIIFHAPAGTAIKKNDSKVVQEGNDDANTTTVVYSDGNTMVTFSSVVFHVDNTVRRGQCDSRILQREAAAVLYIKGIVTD